MNLEAADLIVSEALGKVGQDFIDGPLVADESAFTWFYLLVAQVAFPADTVTRGENNSVMIGFPFALRIDVPVIFKGIKPFSPGHNRDLVTKSVAKLLVTRAASKGAADQMRDYEESGLQLDQLILVPKSRRQLQAIGKQVDAVVPGELDRVPNLTFVTENLNERLVGLVALDGENHWSYVTEQLLSTGTLTKEAVIAAARKNIEKRASKVSLEFKDGVASLGSDGIEGGVVSTLIFAPNFWRRMVAREDTPMFLHLSDDHELTAIKMTNKNAVVGFMIEVVSGAVDSLIPGVAFVATEKGVEVWDAKTGLDGLMTRH